MPVATQQLVILSQDHGSDNGLAPIGARQEILDQLLNHNTAPQRAGEDVLYGPGIRIEMPPEDPVTQMLMTITEEEIGWQVIMRLAKIMRWKLFDPVTGREFIPQGDDTD
ncbi:MAG: hypothetical protein ACYTGG_11710 [Planctomycetota bacterium]|jgi:hypothetical protein